MTRTADARKVLVVDDSPLVRELLCELLGRHPGLRVVGTARDPYEARERIIELQPDVLTLDLEMPRMDGLTFLAKLMKAHPLPVVVVSSLAQEGSATVLEAFALGAVEVIGKPPGELLEGLQAMAGDIGELVHGASLARVHPRPSAVPPAERPRQTLAASPGLASHLIALGASTGGTEAIGEILQRLPGDLPPIVMVQHMLPGFTAPFAERLNRSVAPVVREARDGERAEPGHAYLAPSEGHLALEKAPPGYRLRVLPDPPVNRHRPSVDVLFRSVARAAGSRALGALLTGMGQDGAAGLLEMRQAQALTLAQDEESSVVYGMPRVAWERGAAQARLSLGQIPGRILEWVASLAGGAS